MPAGSTRRVPGASSGALYRRSAPCTRSPAAAGTLSGRAAAAAEAGVADPPRLDRTGMAARPPRTLRRPSVPLPTPSVRSASACFRLPLVMFTHVPLLVRSEAFGAVHRLVRPSVMSLRENLRIGSGPALAALTDTGSHRGSRCAVFSGKHEPARGGAGRPIEGPSVPGSGYPARIIGFTRLPSARSPARIR